MTETKIRRRPLKKTGALVTSSNNKEVNAAPLKDTMDSNIRRIELRWVRCSLIPYLVDGRYQFSNRPEEALEGFSSSPTPLVMVNWRSYLYRHLNDLVTKYSTHTEAAEFGLPWVEEQVANKTWDVLCYRLEGSESCTPWLAYLS